MSKGYFVCVYREIRDPAKLAAYAKLGGPIAAAAGGRFLIRGVAEKAYEAGAVERTVIIEFESVERAIAWYEGPAYQAALAVLGDGALRDVRIVPGL
jgi:uncharacterized protein (DUF1330 family)